MDTRLGLGHCLDALEAGAGMQPGTVRIIPVTTETPRAVLRMQESAAAGAAAHEGWSCTFAGFL